MTVAYGLVLSLHSALRWAVWLATATLALACVHGLATGRSWARIDDLLARLYVTFADTQLALGLALYFAFSPIAREAFEVGPRASGGVPQLWFFGYVHPTAMFGAFVIAHMARAKGRRATVSRSRFRALGLGAIASLVLFLAATPWPTLAWGRALWRGP